MSHYFSSMRANIMEEAIHPFHFGAKGKTEIKMNVVQKRQIDKSQNDWATAHNKIDAQQCIPMLLSVRECQRVQKCHQVPEPSKSRSVWKQRMKFAFGLRTHFSFSVHVNCVKFFFSSFYFFLLCTITVRIGECIVTVCCRLQNFS